LTSGARGRHTLDGFAQLESENAKLKKLVAERDLEIEVMREVACSAARLDPDVRGRPL
jgi:hypothetical protein